MKHKRKCDICGWEYDLVKKDFGGSIAPVILSDDIRITRYDERSTSFEDYTICRGCANDISNFIKKQNIKHMEFEH